MMVVYCDQNVVNHGTVVFKTGIFFALNIFTKASFKCHIIPITIVLL